MAFIIYIPVVLAGLVEAIYLKNLIFHLPLLLADLVIYFTLIRIHPNKNKEILFYYVLSPIIFYSAYIHTQLDLIPTAFVFVSTYFLIKNRTTTSYFILGLAVATKIHTVVALPFFILYSFRKKILKPSDLCFFIPIVITAFTFILFGKLSWLFQANEIALLFESYIRLLDLKLYLFPLIFIGLLFAAANIKRYNSEIFLGILTIVFMTFVIAIYPNPGWFTWSIPFLVHSFIKNNSEHLKNKVTYSLISLFYLVFFLFFYIHPLLATSNFIFLGKEISLVINHPILRNISLTVLFSISLFAIYSVFRCAISNSILYKRKFNGFVIGIAGDSGAGKSTLLESLSLLLGNNMITQLEGDAEHKWSRGDRQWSKLTHLNPKANELHLQMSHIIKLKQGLSTSRRDYNHKTGTFDLYKAIKPNDFIVIAGLHPYFLKGARKHFDFKVFIETQEELRIRWKEDRDLSLRGKSKEEIKREIASRQEDSNLYIKPQREFADLVINYELKEKDENYICLSYEIDADIYLDELIKELEAKGVQIKEHFYSSDLTKQVLKIESYDHVNFEQLQFRFQEILELCSISNPKWQSGIYGLNQVILLHCIHEKYVSNEYDHD